MARYVTMRPQDLVWLIACTALCAACNRCQPTSALSSSGTALANAPPAARPPTRSPKPKVPLGLNLSSVNYYATALPFTDAMKTADVFHSTNAVHVEGGKNEWDTGLADRIPRDELGYPLELPYAVPGAEAPQQLVANVTRSLYAGRYTLLYDGDGEVEIQGNTGRVVESKPGRIVAEFTGTGDLIFVAIKRSARANHVRNMRLLLPGFDGDGAERVFHPDYVARLRGVGALRFMDWGNTNDSPLEHWRDRPTPPMSQGTERGVALEYMIDLANQVDADAWFCVPHRADDDFVEHMAELIKARLDPKHKVYIEYSNELWNSIFAQTAWASERGCAAGLNRVGIYTGPCSQSGPHFWAGIKWNARRSAQIFRTFERVFGGSERLVRVLAGQAAYPELNQNLLMSFAEPKVNPLHNQADALAIAPYVGASLLHDLASDGLLDAMTPAQIAEQLASRVDHDVRKATELNYAVAKRFGLRLIAYEGGQHLVAPPGAPEDSPVVRKLIATNREPRMKAVYDRMLDAWFESSGNDLMMMFAYIAPPNQHGAWGLLEAQTQPNERAPKFQAYAQRLQRLRAPAAAR